MHPSGYMKKHEMIHTSDKQFKCTKCGNRFSLFSYLKTHQRFNTGEKPFKCTKCRNRFSLLGYLKTHEWTYKGEKPLKCTKCGNRKQILLIRLLLNTLEDPHKQEDFQVHKAWQNIILSRLLKTHEMIHKGAKQFKCTKCVKSFSESIIGGT